MSRFHKLRFFLIIALNGSVTGGYSQSFPLTPDPDSWRSVVYTDLTLPGPETRRFAEIWADSIDKNNKSYKKAGDTRYIVANAPTTESHFIVRSPEKTVMVSVLNTATGCTVFESDNVANVTLKKCPMRLVIYSGGQSVINDAGMGCFLEYGKPPANSTVDLKRNAAYAAYDVDKRTIRMGIFLAGKAYDKCIFNVPV